MQLNDKLEPMPLNIRVGQAVDVVGQAQTGTGKTAAFALPLLQNLAEEGWRPGPTQTSALIHPTPSGSWEVLVPPSKGLVAKVSQLA